MLNWKNNWGNDFRKDHLLIIKSLARFVFAVEDRISEKYEFMERLSSHLDIYV
jgi:hypothetical protein